ncbi:thiol reductant ABC exporter subunit CydD [Sphingomonas sp. Leaf257]|jgi:ATP-binding cassette subfamily C protein CydD|uniref:thiol reductant ABC exporter subunit CydD n=1 Tax=Sphingomonas sp. Leaf257 TaxID=1736309 RepID=UPI0006F26F4F|nr:thiol reductant ABC exporter subunit CydD [Sphingomonas sp. Leaf257]KQO51554.1 ABC transporter ATP-binding protein [Sphingomonas sp. Leaf257]
MTTIAHAPPTRKARNRWLNDAAGRRDGVAGLLLLDTLAAIGFAAGVAGGVTAVMGQGAVWPWAVLILGMGALRAVFATLALRRGAMRAGAVKRAQRLRAVAATLRRKPGAPIDSGLLASQAVDAVEALDGYISRFLPARRAAAIAPMLVLVATACASWVAAVILAGTLLPFVAAMILAGGAAADESRRQFVALHRLSARFADRVRSLPVVLAFRAETRETEAIGVAAQELAERTMRVLRVAFLSSAALEFFAALSVALVAVYCGFALLGLLPFAAPETLTLARAFFVLALAPEFYAPMRRLAAAYHDKQAAETAADTLMPLIEPEPVPLVRVTAPLILRDVAIQYPGSDAPAVSHLSLRIDAGETVALLGPSGSGKTSVLHLLLGLAPLSAGTVEAGGGPLTSLAGHASWAGQHPLLIAGTIRDNLTLAHPRSDELAIQRAVAAAGLGPILAARPGGLGAMLDARGSGLSGGERRRIALARALLNPALFLLLDEPTAHLDAAAEAALIATIARAAKERTTLIATHSPALAAIATRVVHLGHAA